jgi:hypothetical protein
LGSDVTNNSNFPLKRTKEEEYKHNPFYCNWVNLIPGKIRKTTNAIASISEC